LADSHESGGLFHNDEIEFAVVNPCARGDPRAVSVLRRVCNHHDDGTNVATGVCSVDDILLGRVGEQQSTGEPQIAAEPTVVVLRVVELRCHARVEPDSRKIDEQAAAYLAKVHRLGIRPHRVNNRPLRPAIDLQLPGEAVS
jgi:hypothetical protein